MDIGTRKPRIYIYIYNSDEQQNFCLKTKYNYFQKCIQCYRYRATSHTFTKYKF